MKILKAGRPVFLVAAFIFLIMMVSVVMSDAATCTITIDGKKISTDADPVIVNNTTLVPASAIVSGLGGTSSWDQSTKTATFVYGSNTVKVTIGSKTATLNGEKKTITVAPQLQVVDSKGGARTMVPLRFIGESFGYNVDWNSSTRTVIITSPVTEEPSTPSQPAVELMTVSSTKITTGQKLSGDTSNTYTNVQITATESLKAGSYKGVWLDSPYRYYIDFDNAKTGTDTSTKTCSSELSQVSQVRAAENDGNKVRVVVDMKSKVTPTVTYSSDGKTMILSFKENKASTTTTTTTPSTGTTTTTTPSAGTTTTTTPTTTTSNTIVGSDTKTDSGTIKKDNLTEYNPYSDGKIVVAIDPGHGKTTGGKRSPDSSLMEWEFNRDVAYRLKSLLEAQGYTVIMTVSKDDTTDPSLASRVAVANNAGNVDLFVSIHGNANGSGSSWNSAHGWEIWIHKAGGASEKAASYIEAATKASITEFTDRGIKKTDFAAGNIGLYVSRNTEMPSVLIEHGFYTNQTECQLMKTDSFRQRLAQADATGIINFFNSFK